MNCCRNLTLLSDTRNVFSKTCSWRGHGHVYQLMCTVRLISNVNGMVWLGWFQCILWHYWFSISQVQESSIKLISNLELFHIVFFVPSRPYRVPWVLSFGTSCGEIMDKDCLFEHNSIMFGCANDNIRCIIIYIKLYIWKTAFFQPSTQEKFNWNPLFSLLRWECLMKGVILEVIGLSRGYWTSKKSTWCWPNLWIHYNFRKMSKSGLETI